MKLVKLLRVLQSALHGHKRARARRSKFRPRLECLEDRALLANVAPTVFLNANPPVINEGDSTMLAVNFVDPGDTGPHAVAINWGDGNSITQTLPGGVFSIPSFSHTYGDNNP